MAAIVRVKRSLDEDPLNIFILKHKKRKLDLINSSDESSASEQISTTVLKFAGTVEQTDNILAHLKNKKLPDPEELKTDFKKHTVNLTDKLRLEHQEASKNSRYKIVNFIRSASLDTTEDNKVTILEVETDINQNDAKTTNKNTDTENKYVYDLYYTNSDEIVEAELEDYVSIYPIDDPLIVGSHRDNGYNNSDTDDSEDSNAECNWRNDYPDEDDMESINEDDMVDAMKNVELDDLSNDSGEEDFVYCVDSDGDYEDALGGDEDDDENQFGKRYAAFKAKHKNYVETSSFKNDLYYGDIDEEEYYY